MSVTQIEIERKLATMKSLLDEVTSLRWQAIAIQTKLDIIKRDYDLNLSQLDARVNLQERRIQQLTALLAGRQQPTPPVFPPIVQDSRTEVAKVHTEDAKPSMHLPENPRTKQKRALADHIFLFIASDQESIVMRDINALLTDDRRDIGDMLEILTWGAIWTSYTSWETSEDQYARLEGWHSVLQERLTYWQHEIRHLKEDWRYEFWQEKESMASEKWQNFLDDLVRQQEEHIENLVHKVTVLEQEWQKRRMKNGENDV